jgi:5'-deoxynucleotidase YfbR-like HD superfamily hydrolase
MPGIGSDELRHFVQSFLIDVARGSFSPCDFVFELYRMKSLPRQGWLDRGIAAAAPGVAETVAEHEYRCCLLTWFLLPDSSSGDNYDKRAVIELLLVHDIAETYIGDQVTHAMKPDALERYRPEEDGAMQYVRAREALNEMHGAAVAFDRWSAFYRADESSNSRLAKDFDRLENLLQLQLHLCRDQLTSADYEAFRDSLMACLQTPLVRGLAQSLKAWVVARGPERWPVDEVAKQRLFVPRVLPVIGR